MLRRAYSEVRRQGLGKTLRRAWGTTTSFGLRCDLAALPPRRPAKIALSMVPAGSAAEAGLLAEVEADPENAEAAQRVALCNQGVRRLYVARDQSGAACYCQWVIWPQDHHLIDEYSPGLYPKLAEGEVLLEGAYTYGAFRRLGAMADGMHQLSEIARSEGAKVAFTYVASDYPPSIRGCANVGYDLDHLRVSTRRLFRRTLTFVPPDAEARAAWETATGRVPE